MSKEKTKVYLYTRVSTLIQVEGYSLDAQKSKMKAFCEYNDYEIAGERDVKTIWRTGFIVHMIKWTRWKICL